jgi:O-methyltransferase involved in polyketide biosynthesis
VTAGRELAERVYRMDEDRPNLTVEGAAIMRALHQPLDDEPKIDDPVASRLVDAQSGIYKSRVELLERFARTTRSRFKATFVMRSRYPEDCLAGWAQIDYPADPTESGGKA